MFIYVKKYIENDFNLSNKKCMQIKLLTFCKKKSLTERID